MITLLDTLQIIDKYLDNAHLLYEHDGNTHAKGRCSYPVIALCSAEEQKWKDGIKELAKKLRKNIWMDLCILDKRNKQKS